MRRLLIYTALLVIGILAALYIFLPAKIIEFSQSEVEQVLEAKLPQIVDQGVVTITIRSVILDFRKDNIASVKTSFDASGLTLEGQGQASLETGIRYENGNFYLSDLTKEDISFAFSENSSETIADIRSSIANILNREEAEAAESGDTQKAGTLSRVREYAETELLQDAEQALDRFLSQIPIYSLNNQGSALKLAALAMEDVTISEGKVTATLSFQALIVRVVIAIFSALLMGMFVFGPVGLNLWLAISKANKS